MKQPLVGGSTVADDTIIGAHDESAEGLINTNPYSLDRDTGGEQTVHCRHEKELWRGLSENRRGDLNGIVAGEKPQYFWRGDGYRSQAERKQRA